MTPPSGATTSSKADQVESRRRQAGRRPPPPGPWVRALTAALADPRRSWRRCCSAVLHSSTDNRNIRKLVGRTHEEIAGFREEWGFGSKRFGRVEGYRGPVERIPPPPIPPIGIKPRLSPRRSVPSAWG